MLITDIINILGNEFSSIYCVNRQDQYIQIYRHLNENTELDELMNEKKTYETVIQKYIETNVFEEDRNKMLVATDFNMIYNKNSPTSSGSEMNCGFEHKCS